MNTPNVKSASECFVGFFTRAFLILPPALLISMKFDLPHILILAAILLSVPFFLRKPFPLKERPLIYTFLSMALLAVLPDIFFEIEQARYSFSDIFLRSNLFIPILLYASAGICFFRRSREFSAILALTVLFALLICGDVYNTRFLVNRRLLGSTELLHNFRIVYIGAVVLQSFGLLLLLNADFRYDADRKPVFLGALRLLSVALLAAAVWGIGFCYFLQEKNLKQLSTYVQRSARHYRMGDAMEFFPLQQNISQPRPPWQRDLDNILVLRVKSEQTPGYLRACAYETYQKNGFWSTRDDSGRGRPLPASQLEPDIPIQSFVIAETNHFDTKKMEILPESTYRSKLLPIPANAETIQISAEEVKLLDNGVISCDRWTVLAGYSILLPKYVYDSAGQIPELPPFDLPHMKRYLQIPQENANLLSSLLFKILKTSKPSALSDKEIIRLITQWFASNFQYSLDALYYEGRPRPVSDPMRKFLIESRKGHCELFATATVLLLRQAGIPARYVTGFLCNEKYPASNFYYAAGRDAHAWTEAWIESERRWILVESTPPSSRTAELAKYPRPNPARVAFDFFKYPVLDFIIWIRRGYPAAFFADVIVWCYVWFMTEIAAYPARMAALLFLIISGILAFRFWLYFRAERKFLLPQNLRVVSKKFAMILCRVERLSKSRRPEWQSLHEWASSLHSSAFDELLLRYEALRFRGSDCSPEERDAFVKACADFRKKFRPV